MQVEAARTNRHKGPTTTSHSTKHTKPKRSIKHKKTKNAEPGIDKQKTTQTDGHTQTYKASDNHRQGRGGGCKTPASPTCAHTTFAIRRNTRSLKQGRNSAGPL